MEQIVPYKKYKLKLSKVLVVAILSFLLVIVLVKILPKEPTQESQFINEIASEAVALKQQTGILPSVIIAQAILESNYGTSELAIKANNLFGVKGSYHGKSITMPTNEYKNNKIFTGEAEFRAYPNWKSALMDHTRLLSEGTSWNKNQYQEVLHAKSYKEAAYALKNAHYSTDPAYPTKLITIIEQYQLEKYDG